MWNLLTCNPSYQVFLRKKESKRLKDSLGQITPTVPTESHKFGKFSKTGTKKIRIREENLHKIEQNNHILLRKMLIINNTPSNLNQFKLKPRCLSTNSLNWKNRIDSQNRIITENKKLLERLQSTQSVYSAEKWESEFRVHEWIKSSHLRAGLKEKEREGRKVLDERSSVSKSQFEAFQPRVFDELKTRFYENYE